MFVGEDLFLKGRVLKCSLNSEAVRKNPGVF